MKGSEHEKRFLTKPSRLLENRKQPFYYFDLFRYFCKSNHLKQHFSQQRTFLKQETAYSIFAIRGRMKYDLKLKLNAFLEIFKNGIQEENQMSQNPISMKIYNPTVFEQILRS